MHPHVHCSIIHGGQDVETTKVPFDGQLDKGEVAPITIEYYSAVREEEIPPFVTTAQTDLENIMLSEITVRKVKNQMISLVGGI